MRIPFCLRSTLLPALSLVAALGASAPLLAQESTKASALPPASELVDDPQQISLIEEGRKSDGARQHIEVITSHFPRRMTGSPQLEMAQKWVVTSFESWGVQAEMEQWGEVEVGFDRDGADGRVVSPEEQLLTFITPAWSPGTPGPVRGKALLEPLEESELRERAEEFAGAWVLRHADVPRAKRRARRALLVELGVAGLLQPGLRDGRLLMGGSRNIKWDSLPQLVRITILYEQYKALEKQVKAEVAVELEFDIRNQFLHGPLPQYNVFADIVGSEWPDEYVIVQGHIDGWDGAQGACDNGTGTATTMEAARLILESGIQPRRTIRFVFYGGEEQGLLGSRGYVERHVGELDKVSVVLNHDNGTNYLAGIQATPAMLEDFEAVFAPIQKLDPERPFEIREVPGLRSGASDHASFLRVGVPAFAWTQSTKGYKHLHHTQFDRLDQVNDDDQRHSSLVVALAAVRFANLDHLVDRAFMREPRPRRMGVYLASEDGTLVEGVSDGGRAAKAGWQQGDRILAIDGNEVKGRGDLISKVQDGGSRQEFLLEREGQQVESALDWSDDPLEEERQAWRARREAQESAAPENADG